MPKETGIIMSGSHPVDILEGRKTMTRRTWGLELINKAPDTWEYVWDALCQQHRFYDKYYKDAPPVIVKCPYGQVGDRLWTKETFMFKKGADAREIYVGTDMEYVLGAAPHYLYKADDTDEVQDYSRWYKWRSPRFMPRRASRITLEITEVRAERLNQISGQDIKAEGLDVQFTIPGAFDALERFSVLWDSLNGKRYPWASNPWVFPISFKVLNSSRVL